MQSSGRQWMPVGRDAKPLPWRPRTQAERDQAVAEKFARQAQQGGAGSEEPRAVAERVEQQRDEAQAPDTVAAPVSAAAKPEPSSPLRKPRAGSFGLSGSPAPRKAWADMSSDSDSDGEATVTVKTAHASSSQQVGGEDGVDAARAHQAATNSGSASSTAAFADPGSSPTINTAEVPASRNVSRQPIPQTAPTSDAMQWAVVVQKMSSDLLSLVKSAPSAGPPLHSVEVATTVTDADLQRWQLAANRLQELQKEREALVAAEAAETARTNEAEKHCSKAQAAASLAAQHFQEVVGAAADARAKAHTQAMLAVSSATSALEKAERKSLADMESARKASEARDEAFKALQRQAAAKVQEADRAEQELAAAKKMRERVDALPTLLERRKVGEEHVARAVEECAQLQRSIDDHRMKLDAASAQSRSRIEALEVKITVLERDIRELQPGNGSAENNQVQALADAELEELKEKNKHLMNEVKAARVDRDLAGDAVQDAKRQVDEIRKRFGDDAREHEELTRHYTELSEKKSVAEAEVVKLQENIAALELRVQETEEANQNASTRTAQVEGQKRALISATRRANEAVSVLEWRLQKAVVQLDKDKPNSEFARLLSGVGSRPGAALGAGLQQRAPRAKRIGAPGGQLGGSDADVESTTAGESVADGLP